MQTIQEQDMLAQSNIIAGRFGRVLDKDRIVRKGAGHGLLHKTYTPRDPSVVIQPSARKPLPGSSRRLRWRKVEPLGSRFSTTSETPGEPSPPTTTGPESTDPAADSNKTALRSIKIKLNPPAMKPKGKIGRPRKYPVGHGPGDKPAPKRRNKKRVWNVLPRELRPSLRSYFPPAATQPNSQTRTYVDIISPGWTPSYQNDWSRVNLLDLMDREYDHFSKCVCSAAEGCEESCWNKTSQIECVSKICPQGKKDCGNRQIQMREKLLKSLLETSREDAKQFDSNPDKIMMSANVTRSLGFEVVKAPNKGYGLVASRDLEPGTFIMEYTGLALTTSMARTFARNNTVASPHFYGLSIAEGIVLDSTTTGSEARFVNHSCSPNCIMEKWLVEGLPRIALFVGKKKIPKGVELTYDYNFNVSVGAEPQVCRCGASNCRGFIGKKSLAEVSVSASVNINDDSVDISTNSTTSPTRAAKVQVKRRKRSRIAPVNESDDEAEYSLKVSTPIRKRQLRSLDTVIGQKQTDMSIIINQSPGPSSSDFSEGNSSSQESYALANAPASRSSRYSARNKHSEDTNILTPSPSSASPPRKRGRGRPRLRDLQKEGSSKPGAFWSPSESGTNQAGHLSEALATQTAANKLLLTKLAEISSEIGSLRSEVVSLRSEMSALTAAKTRDNPGESSEDKNSPRQIEPVSVISSLQITENIAGTNKNLLDLLRGMASNPEDAQDESDRDKKWKSGPIYSSGKFMGYYFSAE